MLTFRFQPDPKALDRILLLLEKKKKKKKKINKTIKMKHKKCHWSHVTKQTNKNETKPKVVAGVQHFSVAPHYHKTNTSAPTWLNFKSHHTHDGLFFFSRAGDLLLFLANSLLLHTTFLPWFEFFQCSAKPALGHFLFCLLSWWLPGLQGLLFPPPHPHLFYFKDFMRGERRLSAANHAWQL